MPTNSVIRMNPSQARTMRALRASGGRKAGTPSDTASTPVSAAQPEEKARSTRKSDRSWVTARSAVGGGGVSHPATHRTKP